MSPKGYSPNQSLECLEKKCSLSTLKSEFLLETREEGLEKDFHNFIDLTHF